MTKREAARVARQLYGRQAFVYNADSPFHYVCDGSKTAGGHFCVVGMGLSWGDAIKYARLNKKLKNAQ